MNEAFLAQFDLKGLARQGWVDVGVPLPESVAAHSWGVALLVIHLLPTHLDMGKALQFATLHDLPEAITGDFTPQDQVSKPQKIELERTALADLLKKSPRATKINEIFEEYLCQNTEEARFVHQLDKLDMALQAVIYRRASSAELRAFIDSAASAIHAPNLQQIVAWCRTQVEDQST